MTPIVAARSPAHSTRTTGSQRAISPARLPDAVTSPAATASSKSRKPVANSNHVRGSVSTTFGGVPRVCRGPSTHCTATNGGTRTSTECPGADPANARAVARTAAPTSFRPGSPAPASINHPRTAPTAARNSPASTLRRPTRPRLPSDTDAESERQSLSPIHEVTVLEREGDVLLPPRVRDGKR
ncbi:Uncharacterised protein [Nocardia farcinica]|uniref:Uncharacterized protein n=1 Tax=Nocardia farcinica TaxID=37329 RepID=A0A449H7K0_NOCFR|nr:Uncharacterised protein [Nocardia farcinica]